MSQTKHPVHIVLQRIQAAAERVGRTADEITLVAVSKTKPVEDILTAYAAGVRHFGENRSAELAEKAKKLAHLNDIQWHGIGHLQSRQSRPIVEQAHYFHAIDREKIAVRLSQQLQTTKRRLPVFIEVNISGEKSKGGLAVANWEYNTEQQTDFLQIVKNITALPRLDVVGFMTMAPLQAPEEQIRRVFRRLKQLSDWAHIELAALNARALSMGMSGDFEIAIEEGATHIRVGSAIFGKR